MKTKLSLPAMLISIILAGCATKPPLQTVQHVDVGRYAGKWHEVARYPNFFERNCTGNITAEYTPLPDGSIQVVNACQNKKGEMERITGKATVVPGSGGAKLKVSFWGPLRGDYWIIGLDEKNYSWAVVGHPSRKFLWVLARTPTLPEPTAQHINELLVQQGYDPSRMVCGGTEP